MHCMDLLHTGASANRLCFCTDAVPSIAEAAASNSLCCAAQAAAPQLSTVSSYKDDVAK